MTVLVLAAEADRGADAVIAELRRRAVRVARVDLGMFPGRLNLRAELDDGRWVGELSTPELTVSLADIRSVWVRSPSSFRLPESLSPPERVHAYREAKLGLGGVLLSLPARWVNRPGHAATACYGPYQLASAHAAGLAVLPTLITNRADAVTAFAHRHGMVWASLLGEPVFAEAGAQHGAYNARYTAAELSELSGLAGMEQTAHQFARWPAKLCEARVVAVGRRLFAVLLHAGSTGAWVDWRSDYESVVYQDVSIEPGLGYAILSLLDTLRLSYAVLEFAVDSDHRWHFLAAHPSAAHEPLESRANLPLTGALASLLHNGPGAQR